MSEGTTLTRADGSACATIERAENGALILNAERVMFVELPVSNAAVNATKGFMRQALWLLRAGPLQDRREMSQAERDAIERVNTSLASRPGWSVRVYRTVDGLRLLVTHALFDPAGSEAQGFMREIGAPATYLEQCRSEGRFHVRVAPSTTNAKPHATCHILKSLRDPKSDVPHDPEAMLVGEWHDRTTRSASELPLA